MLQTSPCFCFGTTIWLLQSQASQQCNHPLADCITYTYHSDCLVVQAKVVLDHGRSFFVMLSSLLRSEIN